MNTNRQSNSKTFFELPPIDLSKSPAIDLSISSKINLPKLPVIILPDSGELGIGVGKEIVTLQDIAAHLSALLSDRSNFKEKNEVYETDYLAEEEKEDKPFDLQA